MRALEISDEEECVGLINSNTGNGQYQSSTPGKPSVLQAVIRKVQHSWKLLLGFALALCVLGVFHASSSFLHETNNGNDSTFATTRFNCPAKQATAENVATAAQEHEEWYETVSEQIAMTNLTDYLQTFRFTEYDNWGHSYNEVKQGMQKWKGEQFGGLKNGDSIYESAW